MKSQPRWWRVLYKHWSNGKLFNDQIWRVRACSREAALEKAKQTGRSPQDLSVVPEETNGAGE